MFEIISYIPWIFNIYMIFPFYSFKLMDINGGAVSLILMGKPWTHIRFICIGVDISNYNSSWYYNPLIFYLFSFISILLSGNDLVPMVYNDFIIGYNDLSIYIICSLYIQHFLQNVPFVSSHSYHWFDTHFPL